jgi:outer membrane translocation and assembly module TamA
MRRALRALQPANAVIGLVILAFAAVADAHGQDVDVGSLRAWQGRTVSGLTVTGMPDGLDGQARPGLALTPRRKLLSMRRAVLRLDAAEADARRIRLLLAREGYPGARVSATAEADGDEHVRITFTVVPGLPVLYGEIIVTGLPPAAAAAADSARILLPRGGRFRDDRLARVRDDLVLGMLRAGHARPDVAITVARPDSVSCDVTFACTPGPTFVYDQLLIDGAPDDLEPLARKVVGLKPGTPYRPSVAGDARRWLRDLDLFRQIRPRSTVRDSTDLADGVMDLDIDLAPRRMSNAGATVGTFSDNPFVIGAFWSHRNLFSRGRGLGVGGSYATHLKELESRAWWPALLTPRSRAQLRLRYEIQDEDSYRLDKTSVELSNLFRPWRHSSLRLGVTVSNGVLDNRSADDEAFVSDVGLQTVLGAMWYNDTSDNPLNPQTGHRLTLQTDWSPPGFWTEQPFASLRAFGSRYVPLGGRRVLALRLDGAVAWPLGDAVDLTPDRRWYAGGTSSMRGYRRRRLGPLDSDGNPIGGEVRILAGAEVRVPLVSIVGMAFFVDSGQVWARRGDAELGDLAVAGGAGLLLGTPVGPVRLDAAYNLVSPAPGEPDLVVHFAIGHPF